MATFTIKQNSTLPVIEIALRATTLFDLSAATSISFVWRLKGSSERLVAAMTIADLDSQIVQYAWTNGDTAVAGLYECQVEVNFGAKTMVFPSTGFSYFNVVPSI